MPGAASMPSEAPAYGNSPAYGEEPTHATAATHASDNPVSPAPPGDPATAAPSDPATDPFDADSSEDSEDSEDSDGPGGRLAAGLSAELAREEAAAPPRPAPTGQGPDDALWDDGMLPLFPLQPPRTGRELLADHVTALVCCAAVDTAGAAPGLDWLDGPSLLVDGERAADLTPHVLSLVEDGDPIPLRGWLARWGVRPEKPVRLV